MERQEAQKYSITLSAFRTQLQYLADQISVPTQKFLKRYLTLLQAKDEHPSHQDVASILNEFEFKKTITKNNLCGGILEKGQLAFRCTQCMLEDNSVICLDCFNKGNHLGHNFEKIQVYGGCCDCGDEEKWEASGFCRDHKPLFEQIKVPDIETLKFIKQMQFLFYIVISSYHQFQISNHVYKLSDCLAGALALKLQQFNQNSLISNQMTFNLFKEPYGELYSDISSFKGQPIKIKNRQCLRLIFTCVNLKQFAKKFVDILTSMFGVPNFREFLTIKFTECFNQNPKIGESEITNITCQIYTSHKMIKKIVEEGRLPAIHLLNFPKNQPFQKVANIYYRYFIDLSYLARLYNGVNTIAMKNQFTKGKINDICYYKTLSLTNRQESIDYYGIEYIFFTYFFNMIKSIRHEKQLLLKMIRDLIEEIITDHNNFVYQTLQRLFVLCLTMYFDGDFSKSFQPQFLRDIGLNLENSSQVKILYNSSYYMLKTYALTLSNRQFGQRYYTFFSFSFFKVDFLVAFDILFLQFTATLFKRIGKVCDFNSINSGPIKKVLKIFEKDQLSTNHEDVYDREKSLGILSDFIGLFIQAEVSDQALINTKAHLGLLRQYEAYHFYADMMCSIKQNNVKKLKSLCICYVGEQLPYFQSFIEKYIDWEGNNIKLKSDSDIYFSAYNLGYIKSKKINKHMERYLATNPNEIDIKRKPQIINDHKVNILDFVFNESMVIEIVAIGFQYLNIVKLDQAVLQTDFGVFSKFIEQLLYLNQIVGNNGPIKNFLEKLSKTESIMNMASTSFRKRVMNAVLGEYTQSTINKDQEQSQKQVKEDMNKKKLEKLEKFKKKQKKSYENHIKSDKILQEPIKEEQAQQQCILCKSQDSQKLGLLSFIQKSNIPMKKLLNSSRDSYIITSCNHFIHESCYNELYGPKQYAYCSICKTTSNLLIIPESKSIEMQEQKEQTLQVNFIERFSVSIALLDDQQQSQKVEMEIQQEKNEENIELSSYEKLFESLILSILCCLEVDTGHFLRSQALCNRYLLQTLFHEKFSIKNLLQKISRQKPESIEQNNMLNQYKQIMARILNLQEIQIIDKNPYIDIQIDKTLLKRIDEIIQAIKSNKTMQPELSFNTIKNLNMLQLPERLDELSKSVGQCQYCHRVTNQIAQCLLCNFKSCKSCQVSDLTNHTFKFHSGACIFIQVDSGVPIYIGGKKSASFQSIYYNILRENFQLGKKYKSKYLLNKEEYQKLQKIIRNYQIQQQIRYRELIKMKVEGKRY